MEHNSQWKKRSLMEELGADKLITLDKKTYTEQERLNNEAAYLCAKRVSTKK